MLMSGLSSNGQASVPSSTIKIRQTSSVQVPRDIVAQSKAAAQAEVAADPAKAALAHREAAEHFMTNATSGLMGLFRILGMDSDSAKDASTQFRSLYEQNREDLDQKLGAVAAGSGAAESGSGQILLANNVGVQASNEYAGVTLDFQQSFMTVEDGDAFFGADGGARGSSSVMLNAQAQTQTKGRSTGVFMRLDYDPEAHYQALLEKYEAGIADGKEYYIDGKVTTDAEALARSMQKRFEDYLPERMEMMQEHSRFMSVLMDEAGEYTQAARSIEAEAGLTGNSDYQQSVSDMREGRADGTRRSVPIIGMVAIPVTINGEQTNTGLFGQNV